jgi:hypothetical protein
MQLSKLNTGKDSTKTIKKEYSIYAIPNIVNYDT